MNAALCAKSAVSVSWLQSGSVCILIFLCPLTFPTDFISRHGETRMLPDLKLTGLCHSVATCSIRHFRSTSTSVKVIMSTHGPILTGATPPLRPALLWLKRSYTFSLLDPRFKTVTRPRPRHDCLHRTAKLTRPSKDHMERRRNTL